MPNPFGTTFESLESPAGPVVDSVHEIPYRRLLELIDSGEGQLISLRAPRAGYGKTMLLSRLREKKKSSITIIPIHLADGRRIEGERVLEEILTQLTESVPGSAGLTKMDLHARRLFAHGLIPMVYSGEVPSQDKEGALASLRERPTEAFDFHNEGAAIAQWTKSQFKVLSPRLSSVLGKASGASTRDTTYWVSRLFDFAIRTPNEPSRTGELMETVFGPKSRFRSGAGFLDGLGSFLNLITLVEPTVLVLDEVDGLSSDSDSALRTTSSLISLWEAAPRMSVVISVNDDVWESAFAPRLPLGLRDRLEDVVIRLKPLTADEARSLVKVRSGDDADRVLQKLDLSSDSLYPRGVLKAARDAWNEESFEKESAQVDAAGELAKEEISEDSPIAEASDKAAEVEESKEPSNVATVIAEASTKVALENEASPFKEFSAPKVSEVANEVKEEVGATAQVVQEAPAVAAAPPEPKKTVYPPIVVRRVEVPKAFDVVRIRPTAQDFSAAEAVAASVPQGFQEVAPPVTSESTPTYASPFEVAPAAKAPETSDHAQVSPFGAAPETVIPAPAQPAAEPPQSSPFEIAAPAAVAPEPPSQVSETPFSVASPSAESVSKEQVVVASSPFDVAAVETASPNLSSAPTSPFETAPSSASPFTERPAAVEPVSPEVNRPFQVDEKATSENQSILPPARTPQPPAMKETPAAAPEVAPAPVETPVAPLVADQPEIERRRVYPSKSPFDVASTPAAPPAQAAQTPPAFTTPPAAQEIASPFEANLAPQAVPPQPEVPKADADAIDELLRQFREHRDA